MAFHFGQPVVCCHEDYSGGEDEWGNQLPVCNTVYHIRGFVTDHYTHLNGIFLEEIVNKPLPLAPDGKLVGEAAFNICHFRPVAKIKPTKALLIAC